MPRQVRNAPLPEAQRPRTNDTVTQRAFDALVTPLVAIIKFLQPFAQPEKWKPLPLDPSVSNFAADYVQASYRKNPLGVVEVRGEIVVSGAHGGTHVLGTLPLGYRPRLNEIRVISDSGASVGLVQITPQGVIEHLVGGHAHISMHFSFDTVNE